MGADRIGLGFLGFIFGGVTAAVMLVAIAVVVQHVDRQFAAETPAAITVAKQ